MVDHNAIHRARNRTRLPYRGYAHEATLGLIATIGADAGQTRSETIETLMWMVLIRMRKDVSWLPDDSALRIRRLRGVLTGKG